MDSGFQFPQDAGGINKRYSLPLSATTEPNPPFVFPPRDDSLYGLEATKSDLRPYSLDTSGLQLASPPASPSRVPNPPFSFAAAQAEALGTTETVDSTIRAPEHPSFSRSYAARTSSRHNAPPPLPAFSFNPSSPAPANPSPSSPMLIPSPGAPRSAGHRRRGSEFIGGDGITTSPGLMSTSASPTRTENPLPLPGPALAPPGPPAGRRGHAHRRSAAISISSVDLGAVKKNGGIPGNSAPNTPAYQSPDYIASPEWSISPAASNNSLTVDETPLTSTRRGSAPESAPRSRVVEFSDTVTVIPRPLSTVSSETASSHNLFRGHSVTNSISSIVSSGAASSSQTSLKIPELSTTLEEPPKPRPKTADPSLAGMVPFDNQSFSEWQQRKRPLTATSPGEPSGSESGSVHSPLRKRHSAGDKESSSEKRTVSSETSRSAPESGPSVSDRKPPCKRPSSEFKRSKSRNVRNWAGSILSRKGRRAGKQPVSRRTPTPPLLSRTVSVASSEINFDDDNVVVIRDPNAKETSPQPTYATNEWKPKSYYEQSWEAQRDPFSPVIDLDAALGPFQTPEMGRTVNAGSAFSVAAKRMHSGGRRGEFVGPEMRYHRRAESAPEMPPVDRIAFGIHRLGSNSTMADYDVFDEEEEDEFLASTTAGGKVVVKQQDAEKEDIGLGVSIVDSADDATSVRSKQHSEMASILEAPVEESQTHSIVEESIDQSEPTPVSVRSTSLEVPSPEQARRDKFASGCTITPSSNVNLDNRPSTAPIDFAYPFPSPYAQSSTHSSITPSPDPSSITFEHPRSGTGTTSLTDRQTNPSVYSSERGGSMLRPSNDDLRSMTSNSSNPVPFSGSADGRSASYSLPSSRRSRIRDSTKRGSIVSLSRLMGVGSSSSGSSKLRHETNALNDDDDLAGSTATTPDSTLKKRKSSSARHRLSRVFSFLKSEEKSASKEKL